jgi:hypothetical protein
VIFTRIFPTQEFFNNEFDFPAAFGGSVEILQILLIHKFDLNTHFSEYIGNALALVINAGNIPLILISPRERSGSE